MEILTGFIFFISTFSIMCWRKDSLTKPEKKNKELRERIFGLQQHLNSYQSLYLENKKINSLSFTAQDRKNLYQEMDELEKEIKALQREYDAIYPEYRKEKDKADAIELEERRKKQKRLAAAAAASSYSSRRSSSSSSYYGSSSSSWSSGSSWGGGGGGFSGGGASGGW